MSAGEIESFLSRIETRLAAFRGAAATEVTHMAYLAASECDVPLTDSWSHGDLAARRELFARHARARGAIVDEVPADDVVRFLMDWAQLEDVSKIALWAHEPILDGFLGQAPDQGLQEMRREGAEAFSAAAEHAELGIVTAEAGVAATGTIVLRNGWRRARLTSLLPPRIAVVLREQDIVFSVREAMRVAGRKPLPACVNFITGPSSSADIEGDIFVGVHGPGTVKIVIATGPEIGPTP